MTVLKAKNWKEFTRDNQAGKMWILPGGISWWQLWWRTQVKIKLGNTKCLLCHWERRRLNVASCRPSLSNGWCQGGDSTSAFYTGLVEANMYWEKTPGLHWYKIAGLLGNIFEPEPMDNFQRTLAWKSYLGSLFGIASLGTAFCQPSCSRCDQSSVIVLHTTVNYGRISEIWVFTEHLLSLFGRVELWHQPLFNVIATAKEQI